MSRRTLSDIPLSFHVPICVSALTDTNPWYLDNRIPVFTFLWFTTYSTDSVWATIGSVLLEGGELRGVSPAVNI